MADRTTPGVADPPPRAAGPPSGIAGVDRPSRGGSDYRGLSIQVKAEGLLNRRRANYWVRIVATLVGFSAVWGVVVWLGSSWLQLIAAAVLGIAFTQISFLGHDAGHQQIFRSRRVNDVLGTVAGNLLIGLSYGWWLDKHNRHHANPNKEGHDPDIGDGVLAFTTDQVSRSSRLGRAIVRRQAWLFFPLLTLEGFNLHASSIRSLLPGASRCDRSAGRRTELILLLLHTAAYVTVLLLVMSPLKALAFAAIHQAVWGLYMGCSFAPNHKGMPIIGPDEKVDYLRRQVLTSRNVRGGFFTDLLLGGLNYQIEHHLFPNMPRPSLRRAQRIVRAYCAELNVPYVETSLVGSYAAALRHLNSLGTPLREASASGSRIAEPLQSASPNRTP